jgi:hypothetical protein
MMDKNEARAILAEQIAALRTWTYYELCGLVNDPTGGEVTGPSGAKYQVELDAVWDSRKRGPVRVFVLIDDGGLRAFAPMSQSFIVAPDGSFVGE